MLKVKFEVCTSYRRLHLTATTTLNTAKRQLHCPEPLVLLIKFAKMLILKRLQLVSVK